MKEAAAQMNSFAGRQLGAGLGNGSLRGLAAGGSDRLSEAGSRAGVPGNLGRMQPGSPGQGRLTSCRWTTYDAKCLLDWLKGLNFLAACSAHCL